MDSGGRTRLPELAGGLAIPWPTTPPVVGSLLPSEIYTASSEYVNAANRVMVTPAIPYPHVLARLLLSQSTTTDAVTTGDSVGFNVRLASSAEATTANFNASAALFRLGADLGIAVDGQWDSGPLGLLVPTAGMRYIASTSHNTGLSGRHSLVALVIPVCL